MKAIRKKDRVGIVTDTGESITTLSPSDALDFAVEIIKTANKAAYFQNIPKERKNKERIK